jgi:hypothetical protein
MEASSSVKVNENEHKCLVVLAEDFYDDTEWKAWYMRGIVMETKLELSQVRRAVRSLGRKGLAAYERGLFDDDGMVAGSGYRATTVGKDLIEKEHEEADRARDAAEAQASLPL